MVDTALSLDISGTEHSTHECHTRIEVVKVDQVQMTIPVMGTFTSSEAISKNPGKNLYNLV